MVRFVSLEPLLGPVDLGIDIHQGVGGLAIDRLSWCIVGPETGPSARPCKPEWIEDLYRQCKTAGIPFFDKRKEDWIARQYPM
jgi:protein gp37